MKKCVCKSAPKYHRDDCQLFDTFGNPKLENCLYNHQNILVFASESTRNTMSSHFNFLKNYSIDITYLRFESDNYSEILKDIYQSFDKRNMNSSKIFVFLNRQEFEYTSMDQVYVRSILAIGRKYNIYINIL